MAKTRYEALTGIQAGGYCPRRFVQDAFSLVGVIKDYVQANVRFRV